MLQNISVKNAHASSVTGIIHVNANKLLSVSIDQRLIEWNVLQRKDSEDINFASSVFVDIPDICGIDFDAR